MERDTAREAGPAAPLVYNEHGLQMDNRNHEARRRTLPRLLESFRRRDLPIDAARLRTRLKPRRFRFNAGLYGGFSSPASMVSIAAPVRPRHPRPAPAERGG